MGRGRVQLKRIENKISRQVTFSKRKTGLLKKAKEITVLCDADVGLIVFSSKGKLFDFSNDSCMESILERYERYTCAGRNVVPVESETRGSWSVEHTKLTARIDVLQKNIRNLAGEGLDSLNLKELQYLEQQLDNALRRLRNRKNQAMRQSIAELRKKEKCLHDWNSLLAKTLHGNENGLTEQQMDWNHPHHYQQQQNLAEPLNLTSAAAFMLPEPFLANMQLHGNEKGLTEQQMDWNHPHHFQQQQDLAEPPNLTSAAAIMLPEPFPHPLLTIGSSYHARESMDDNSRTHTRPVMTSIPSWMLSNFNG